jgi:actin, other eukaryote
MDEDHEPLIIDIGTGALKAGFASEHAPKHLIPMVIGEPKSAGILVGMDQKPFYIGKEAIEKKKFLNMRNPIVKGRIKDEATVGDDIHNIIEHLMTQEMLISGEEYKCLITEPPINDASIREALVEMM